MKFAAIFGIAFVAFAAAEETRPEASKPAPIPPPTTSPGQVLRGVNTSAWLGLNFDPMNDAVRAHVPDLPQGLGLVVTEVVPGSPAEKAGIKTYDVFWKLGDQLIANKAQLATLLKLQKEGEEVKFSVYRSGQSLSLPIVLGRQPADPLLGGAPALATAGPDVPMKVVYPTEGSGELKAADGKVNLSLVNGHVEVKIVSSGGAIIFEGPAKDAQGVSLVPEPWKQRVTMLERSLVNGMKNPRPPRLRTVPSTVE